MVEALQVGQQVGVYGIGRCVHPQTGQIFRPAGLSCFLFCQSAIMAGLVLFAYHLQHVGQVLPGPDGQHLESADSLGAMGIVEPRAQPEVPSHEGQSLGMVENLLRMPESFLCPGQQGTQPRLVARVHVIIYQALYPV